MPDKERKKANQQVKAGSFNSRVISTRDLMMMVMFNGMQNVGVRFDPEEAR